MRYERVENQAGLTRNRVDQLVQRLRGSRSVLALTGAGISAESGLPTFRGAGGLWSTHRVEELASYEGFWGNPALVWTWYNERKAAHQRPRPNAGHAALLSRKIVSRGVVYDDTWLVADLSCSQRLRFDAGDCR